MRDTLKLFPFKSKFKITDIPMTRFFLQTVCLKLLSREIFVSKKNPYWLYGSLKWLVYMTGWPAGWFLDCFGIYMLICQLLVWGLIG